MSSERPKVKYIKYVIDQTMRYRNDKILSGISDPIEIERSFIADKPELQQNFPWICKMILKDQDLKPLWVMIKKLEDVENGKADFKETEKNLAKELSDKYIKDIKEADVKMIAEKGPNTNSD